MADRGGFATDDRPDPCRFRTAGAGGAARGRTGARSHGRGRRHPGVDPHVLPAGADPGLGNRPHPARRRRPLDRADRRRLPRPGEDDGTTDRPRQANGRRGRGAVRPPRRRGTQGAAADRALGPLPDLQRGLRGERGARPGPGRAVRRGDPADPDRAVGAARGARGRRPPGADAPHRRAPPGPHRRARRTGAAGRAGPRALGRGGDRGGPPGAERGDRGRRRRSLPAAGGERGRPRPGTARRGHRLGRDPRPLRPARRGSRRDRWWR